MAEVKTATGADDVEVDPNAPDSVPAVNVVTPGDGEDPTPLENNLNPDGSVKSGASLDRLPEMPESADD